MAARSSTVRQQGAAPKRAERRSPLGVVDRRRELERAQRRQVRLLVTLSGAVLAGALTVAAAGHALLASEQYQADGLQQALAGAVSTQQNLQAERAALERPSRILHLATTKFKMVTPSGATYLEPVKVGKTVEQAHQQTAARKSPEHHTAR